jgi:hypothetical protein
MSREVRGEINDLPGAGGALAAPGGALARLLDPVSPQTFVREHWERRALLVKATQDKRAFVQGLGDRGSLQRAMERAHQRATQRHPKVATDFHVRALFPDRQGGWMRVVQVEPHQTAAMLEAGASVCAHDISDGDARLSALAHAVKQELGLPGAVGFSGYISPDGHGLAPHFDAQAILAIQLEGTKRWSFCERPAAPSPAANALLLPDGVVEWSEQPEGDAAYDEVSPPDPGAFIEATLEPGDVLYVPAGTWHATHAAGESTGIVLYFSPLPFSTLIEQLLWHLGERHPAWRSGPPATIAAAGAGGQAPPEVRAYFAERLAELRSWLDALDPGGLPLHRLWRRLSAQGAPPGGEAPLAPPRARAIERRDVLQRSARPLSWAAGVDTASEARVILFCGEEELELGAAAAGFIEALLAAPRFAAEEATRWGEGYAWEEVQALLQTLVAHGALDLVDA